MDPWYLELGIEPEASQAQYRFGEYILPARVTALAGVIKSYRNTEERRPQPAL